MYIILASAKPREEKPLKDANENVLIWEQERNARALTEALAAVGVSCAYFKTKPMDY